MKNKLEIISIQIHLKQVEKFLQSRKVNSQKIFWQKELNDQNKIIQLLNYQIQINFNIQKNEFSNKKFFGYLQANKLELRQKRIKDLPMGLAKVQTCQNLYSNSLYLGTQNSIFERQFNFEEVSIIHISEQIYDTCTDLEILNNMEQIQFLYWQGQYGLKNKKQGKWIALWDGKVLINIGGYYRDGLKQGLWKELIKNYWR